MKYFVVLIVLNFVLLNSCGEKDENEQRISNEEISALRKKSAKAPICIVFCDFTSSLDSTSSIQVIKNAEEIFNELYESYKLKFYSISKNEWERPFFETDLICLNDPRPSEKYQLTRLLKAQKVIDLDSLQRNLRAIAKKKIRPSCIINSIEKSIREFGNYDNSGLLEMRLIIFSDMIESCRSSIGLIDLEKKQYKEANRLIDEFNDTLLTFANFKKLKIDVVISTQKDNSAKDHNELWKRIFLKYRYLGSINLSSTLSSSFGGN